MVSNAGAPVEDPLPTFSYVTREVRDRHPNLAYFHFIEGRIIEAFDVDTPGAQENSDFARAIWNEKGERPFFSAGGYGLDGEEAANAVGKYGGAVVFGRAFVSNPDLVVSGTAMLLRCPASS